MNPTRIPARKDGEDVKESKHHPDRVWLADVNAAVLQQAVRDADLAYRNWFWSLRGERQGRRVGAPRLKSRKDRRQTASFTNAARFRVIEHADRTAIVRLSKIGNIRFVMSRPLPSEPSSVTLIHDADGRWYVSFVVEAPAVVSALAPRRACGIDVGLSSFAAVLSRDLSTGVETVEKIDTPLFLRRRLRALKRSQRAVAQTERQPQPGEGPAACRRPAPSGS